MLQLVLAAALCSPVTQPFTGTLCTPNDGKRHAAMILLGGSEGGDSMSSLSKLFAEHGYVATSVAYFGLKGLPATLVNVPVETVGHAIDALSARPDVDPKRVGILGVSKGGEFALLAASTYAQIKATVAVVPSPVSLFGLGVYEMPAGCSWSRGDKPIPCVAVDDRANAAIGKAFGSGGSVALRPLYDASLDADPTFTNASYFAMENIAGPVLCLAGKDDQLWDSPRHCDMTMDYLRSHGHRFDDRKIVYPDAGHTFISATHGPKSAVTQMSFGSVTMAFGGTAQGDADAATSAWKTIWSFLAATLH